MTASIREWLSTLGLEGLASAFEREGISPELLSRLTDEQLRDVLGVSRLGDRLRILQAAANSMPLHGSPTPSAPTPIAETSSTPRTPRHPIIYLPGFPTEIPEAPSTPHPRPRGRLPDYGWDSVTSGLDRTLDERCTLAYQGKRLRGWLSDHAPQSLALVTAISDAIECGAVRTLLDASPRGPRVRAEAVTRAVRQLCVYSVSMESSDAARVIEVWSAVLGYEVQHCGQRSLGVGATTEDRGKRRERARLMRDLDEIARRDELDGVPKDSLPGITRVPVSVAIGGICNVIDDIPGKELDFLVRRGEVIECGSRLGPRYRSEPILVGHEGAFELILFNVEDFEVVSSPRPMRELFPSSRNAPERWQVGLSVDSVLNLSLHAISVSAGVVVSKLGLRAEISKER